MCIRFILRYCAWLVVAGGVLVAGSSPSMAESDKAHAVSPSDYNPSLKSTQWAKPGTGYFWYQDPTKKKKKKKKLVRAPSPKVKAIAKKKKEDIYIRPEFKDIPFQPGTPTKLKALMGNPTVENARKWLKYQARVVNRATLVGRALRDASLKYGSSIYPIAADSNSNDTRGQAYMEEKRKRYAAKVLADKAVILLFQSDISHCIECNIEGDYANILAKKGLNVIAVMPPGTTPHPRATYPYLIDNGGKLAKKYEAYGERPLFVAIFPDAKRFYTVGRGVIDPNDVLLQSLEYAENDKIVKPFSYSPKQRALKRFMASIGGVKGVGGTFGKGKEREIVNYTLKQGLGTSAQIPALAKEK